MKNTTYLKVLLASALLVQPVMLSSGAAQAQDAAAAALEKPQPRIVPGGARYIPAAKCEYVKEGKINETQLDVFTEEGVYTYCGKVDTTLSAVPVLLPVYSFKEFTSWADHSCAVDGTMQIPDAFRARCLTHTYFVDADFYCKRDGDNDRDGLVDGVKNVPAAMAEMLGAFVIEGMGKDALIVREGADIDVKAPVPQFWSEFGNVTLPDVTMTPKAVIARSFAMPRPNASTEDEKKLDLKVVVHDRPSDLFRGAYLPETVLKGTGAPVVVSDCKAAE